MELFLKLGESNLRKFEEQMTQKIVTVSENTRKVVIPTGGISSRDTKTQDNLQLFLEVTEHVEEPSRPP